MIPREVLNQEFQGIHVVHYLQNHMCEFLVAAISVLCNSDTRVIGPTPPGTGVINEHFEAT